MFNCSALKMTLRKLGVLNIQWIPTVARRTELVDSHSRLVDRIDGFPYVVGCHLVLIL